MRIVWDEAKRRANLRKHALDFADAEEVFSGITYTIEDRRFDYGEQRFITPGMLHDAVVVMAHAEARGRIRILSMRKATGTYLSDRHVCDGDDAGCSSRRIATTHRLYVRSDRQRNAPGSSRPFGL